MSSKLYPKMILFTAPSGAGKTTIVRHLLDTFDYLNFSISATTREKRNYEENGKDYYFVSPEIFKSWIRSRKFAEYEEVYENQYYGTLKSEVERIYKKGKIVIFDIDVKGAKKLNDKYGEDCLSIFVKPPSLAVLIQRLKGRNTEDEKSLKKRIRRMKRELKYEIYFDYTLYNDDLDVALAEAEQVVNDFYTQTLKK